MKRITTTDKERLSRGIVTADIRARTGPATVTVHLLKEVVAVLVMVLIPVLMIVQVVSETVRAATPLVIIQVVRAFVIRATVQVGRVVEVGNNIVAV